MFSYFMQDSEKWSRFRFDMLKYCLTPIILLGLLVCDWLDPSAVWIFFLGFSAFVIIGDTLFGNDRVQYQNAENKLNPILYLILPLLLIKLFNITLLGMSDTQAIIFKILLRLNICSFKSYLWPTKQKTLLLQCFSE